MLDRNFAMGLRAGKRKITEDEKAFILKEIKRINADVDAFYIDEIGNQNTHYSQKTDLVVVGSNVFPDLENPSNMTDKLSVACVLAHEYYGHRSMREEYLKEETDTTNTALDEFKASFLAYKNTPNLTDEEREMLLYQAYETAKNGNLENEIEMCQEIIKQMNKKAFEEQDEENKNQEHKRLHL